MPDIKRITKSKYLSWDITTRGFSLKVRCTKRILNYPGLWVGVRKRSVQVRLFIPSAYSAFDYLMSHQ